VVDVEVSAGSVVVVTLVDTVVTGGVAPSVDSPHPAATRTNTTGSTARRIDVMKASSR